MSNLLENCSICNTSNSVLIKISSADKNQVKWSRKLNLCVPAVDWGDDDDSICPNCIGQLENAYNFYQLCLQSYEVRKQQQVCAVKVEPCFESEEVFDVIVKNSIEDDVESTFNDCFPSEVDAAQEYESLTVDKIEFKSEDLSESEIMEDSTNVASNFIPLKSARTYEKCYSQFMDWRKKNKISNFSEKNIIVYFDELSKTMKSTTLWTLYSILKCTLSVKHKVDISKYSKLQALLKRIAEGYKPKRAKTFSTNDIKRFIGEAPDSKYLLSKVACIFGIMGACRRHELHSVEYKNVNDFKSTLLVTIKDTKTKRKRKFTVTGKYYEICKKYMNLRPQNCKSQSFFINYGNGKCTVQNVGINKFGNMGKEIATYLNLPDPNLYTGHCFRRSSAKILVDTDGDVSSLKSTEVVENDIDESIQNKCNVAKQVLNSIEYIQTNITPSTSTMAPTYIVTQLPQLHFNNFTYHQ